MSDRAEMDRLQICLERVYDASRDLIGYTEGEERAAYVRALAELATAWHAFESTLQDAERADYAGRTASLLARIGDDLFYDFGATNDAITAFELGLSMAPHHAESLKGIIAAYLQGSDPRPAQALPYAERLAGIDPGHERSVTYIRSLIAGR